MSVLRSRFTHPNIQYSLYESGSIFAAALTLNSKIKINF